MGGMRNTLRIDDNANVYYNDIPMILGGGLESNYYIDNHKSGSGFMRTQLKKAVEYLNSMGKSLSNKSRYTLEQNINRLEAYENYLEKIIKMITSYQKMSNKHGNDNVAKEISLTDMQNLTKEWDNIANNKIVNKEQQIMNGIEAVWKASGLYNQQPIINVIGIDDNHNVNKQYM